MRVASKFLEEKKGLLGREDIAEQIQTAFKLLVGVEYKSGFIVSSAIVSDPNNVGMKAWN